MKSIRAERVSRIRELRAEGHGPADIAAILGIARSTVYLYSSDPTGEKEAARKARYGGTCEVCGAPTTGSNGKPKAPKRCGDHRRRPKKWPRERIIEAIQAWTATFGEPPAAADWNPYQAEVTLGDRERAARFRRLRGRAPTFTTVIGEFGTWNAAIKEAGFEPRPSVGTATSARRQRPKPPKTHCDHGHRMTKANVYTDPSGARHCRACRQRRADEVAAARRGLLTTTRRGR